MENGIYINMCMAEYDAPLNGLYDAKQLQAFPPNKEPL